MTYSETVKGLNNPQTIKQWNTENKAILKHLNNYFTILPTDHNEYRIRVLDAPSRPVNDEKIRFIREYLHKHHVDAPLIKDLDRHYLQFNLNVRLA